MGKPNLLLCFDAFGTLFRPRAPVYLQYADIARQCGLDGFTDDDVASSFKTAFRNEAKLRPNYGKSTGLGATKWWTNVIRNTFTPLLGENSALPPELAPRLLHRFSSDAGYEFEPDLVATLRALKQQRKAQALFEDVVLGVITNSDDRVPDILASSGMKVSPLRYGTDVDDPTILDQPYDVDFHCMSYDVGTEKPDRRIFQAAEDMLTKILTVRKSSADPGSYLKIYVGDEYGKDVVGSSSAGWHPVLLDGGPDHPSIPLLRDLQVHTLQDLIKESTAVKVQTIRELANWLLVANKEANPVSENHEL